MNQPQVFYAVSQRLCCFRLKGELRHTETDGLDELIQQQFATDLQAAQGVVIDLSDAEFLDSTCIGLLASIARQCLSQGLPKPSVVVADPELRQLLLSLRLETVFELITPARLPASEEALAPIDSSPPESSQHADMVLRAHEALAGLSRGNRLQFQPVIDLLRQDRG